MSRIKNAKWLFIFSFVLFWGCFRSLNVNASSYDKTAPTIGSIKILQSEIYAPDVLHFEISDIIEEGSGINYISIMLETFNERTSRYENITQHIFIEDSPIFTGDKYIFNFKLPSDINTGKYYISYLSIYDSKGNSMNYPYYKEIEDNVYVLGISYEHPRLPAGELSKYNCTVYGSVKIYGEEFDISTSVANPNVGKLISNMKDGEVANLYPSGSNTIVPKAAFDAIKGTNKKINVSVSDGVKWIFDGKDITGTTKAVNCKVDISTVQDTTYGTTDKLMKTTFASNGQLPGKATVKLKSDYLAKLYNLDQKLYLYYLDGQKLTMEDSDVKTIKDGNDSWCEYELDHNSTFLLSQKKLTYKKPYVKLNTSSLTLQVKQSSSALKIAKKLDKDKVKKWTSSKSSVVSVNAKSGKLKAKKPGTAYITVQLTSGVKAKCKVKVQRSAVKTKSISVGKSKVTIKRKKSYTINVTRKPITANDGKITFKSSKPKIAKVSSKGRVTALRKGKATITVRAGKKVKKITVVVK